MTDPVQIPYSAEIRSREQESRSVFSLGLHIKDPQRAQMYRFNAGQFNMLSLFGVGEIPISIVSDPEKPDLLVHTIRDVGRVTHGFSQLQVGDHIGLRGPYGNGWPLASAEGKDIVLVSGGLGCAPITSVIEHIFRWRSTYGRLNILQGVKHTEDFIWRERYQAWAEHTNTRVLLAADVADASWPGITGPVTHLIERAKFKPENTIAMMCGPEAMMLAAIKQLEQLDISDSNIWLSMERNMQCATGHCGHCQIGDKFVCCDGPVFSYPDVRPLLGKRGF